MTLNEFDCNYRQNTFISLFYILCDFSRNENNNSFSTNYQVNDDMSKVKSEKITINKYNPKIPETNSRNPIAFRLNFKFHLEIEFIESPC